MTWDDQIDLLARLSDSSAENIESLLKLLHPPSDLSRLRLVLRNLNETLSASQSLTQISDTLVFFDAMLVSRLVLTLYNVVENSVPMEWMDESPHQHGLINLHPEWACLILSPSHPFFKNLIYRQHLSVVLHCAATQRQRHVQLGSEIASACRNLRQIASNRKLSGLFELSADLCLNDYLSLLYEDDQSVIAGLAGIELLVRKILEGHGKSRSSGGGHQRIRQSRFEKISIDPEDSDSLGPGIVTLLLNRDESEEKEQQAKISGLHPNENKRLSGVSVRFSQKSSTAGFTAVDHVRRHRASIQHIASGNQRLPFRYAQLSAVELAVAAVGAAEAYKQAPNSPHSADSLAGLLLSLVIWLGRPVEKILTIRLYQSQTLLPKNRRDMLAYLMEEKAFAISIPSPTWKTHLNEPARKLLYDIGQAQPVRLDDVIIVTCPVKLHAQFARCQINRDSQKGRNFINVFPAISRNAVTASFSKMISMLNRANQTRLTPMRLSQLLFDEVSAISTDWTDAYLVTGQSFTTTEVSAHYYSADGKYLQKLYHQAVLSMRNRCYKILGIDAQKYFDFEQKVENEGDFGGRLNIKPDLIKILVSHLKHGIRESKRQSQGEVLWREIHNSLVAYIAFWILFSTGYRAVNDLIFRLREVDWDTGFLVVSDKDDETYSNTRIVWLLPQLRDQIKRYVVHLQIMQVKVSHHGQLRAHINEILDSPEPNVPLLFFVNELGHAIKLTPHNLREHVPEFTLPMNIGRHYLRSTLRSHGCAAEYVNAFLGHWQQGQEPFGRFSSITPFELFNELAPKLELLRKEGGWTAQDGLAHGF